MKKLRLGDKVMVNRCIVFDDLVPLAMNGIVVRLLIRDDSAWIALEKRGPESVHRFPADDPHGRGTHVLAWPEDCDMVPTAKQGRGKARR